MQGRRRGKEAAGLEAGGFGCGRGWMTSNAVNSAGAAHSACLAPTHGVRVGRVLAPGRCASVFGRGQRRSRIIRAAAFSCRRGVQRGEGVTAGGAYLRLLALIP